MYINNVFFCQVTLGKRTVLRRLSQDGGGDGRILSCEVHLPTTTTTPLTAPSINTTGRLAADNSRGVSPSDPGSGRSTPVSPPHHPLHMPMVFSPPPSPMSATNPLITDGYKSSDGEMTSRVFLDFSSRPSCHHQEVSLVLQPVPLRSNNKPSPADSVKTLVNESLPEIQVSTNEEALGGRFGAANLSHRLSPRPLGLQRLKAASEEERSLLASSSLSLPPETVNGAAARLTAFNADMRSKTDNLERLISEVERSSADNVSGGGGLGGREVKKYIRRRYTDSRHPTTELPDVRGEPLPSVQNPPLREGSKLSQYFK